MEQEELHEVVQLPILRNFIMGFCLSESPGCIGGYKIQPAFVVPSPPPSKEVITLIGFRY